MNQKVLIIALISLFSFVLFFYQLNATYLTNWDEAWHAVIARDMARDNDFITPMYNGKVWFATAPLYIWLLAIWFKLTNYSILGVRFFSALAGVGTVLAVFFIGKKIKNEKVGIFASIILATTIQFLFRARQGNLDAPLAFCNTLAVLSFVYGNKIPQWNVAIGVFTAFGFLTKSILGLFPLLLLFLIPRKDAVKALIAFLIVILPWHLAAFGLHGYSFINHYFLQYVLSKATNANPVSGTEVFWYVSVLKHGLKLWFVVFIPSILLTISRVVWSFLKSSNKTRKKRNKYLLPLIWVVFPFIFLTAARMRNDWYIISLYPGIALLIALAIENGSLSIAQYLKAPKKISRFVTLAGVIILGVINIVTYRDSFIVPETTRAEAKLSSTAQSLTKQTEMLMLDDNYLPVALFYSDRNIVPLRYSRSFESLVGDETLKQATESGIRYVLTNTQTIDQLIQRLNHPIYETIENQDDKMLIKLTYN